MYLVACPVSRCGFNHESDGFCRNTWENYTNLMDSLESPGPQKMHGSTRENPQKMMDSQEKPGNLMGQSTEIAWIPSKKLHGFPRETWENLLKIMDSLGKSTENAWIA